MCQPSLLHIEVEGMHPIEITIDLWVRGGGRGRKRGRERRGRREGGRGGVGEREGEGKGNTMDILTQVSQS